MDLEFTSNEELDSFQVGDNTVVVTGAVVSMDPLFSNKNKRSNANVGTSVKPKVPVLRLIMSNFQGREVRTLFWAERVPEFENRVYRQVIRLSRVKVTLADPRFVVPAQNLMAIELSVQNYTTVDILGPIPEDPVDNLPAVPSAELRDVGNMTGPIQMTAFIRYKIVHQVVGNFSYGSGAITDGIHHLCVNVAGMHGESPEPGTHVSLTGELRHNAFDTLILQITDMSNIRIVDNQIMDPKSLKNGFRKIPKLQQQQQIPQQAIAQVYASPTVQQHQRAPAQPVFQQIHQQQQQVTAQIHASSSVAQINPMMYQTNKTAVPAMQSPTQNQPIIQQQEGGSNQVKDQAVSSLTVPDHGDQQVYKVTAPAIQTTAQPMQEQKQQHVQQPARLHVSELARVTSNAQVHIDGKFPRANHKKFKHKPTILQTKKISKPTLQSDSDESDDSRSNDIRGESIVIDDSESESEIEGSPKRQRIREPSLSGGSSDE